MDTSRYSCQVALPGFGRQAQQRLQQSRVLIVGMGGLGCPAAQYLAAAGVGALGITDNDTVSISNLHRQILYTPGDAGREKVAVAAEKLRLQNPNISITPYNLKVTADNVLALFGQYDVILDGTDNFETRYLLNDAAVLSNKPLIYGAIYQYEGQTAVWNAPNPDGTRGPNYRDLYPQVDATQIPNCADGGVIPTIAGMIGCAMANEAIKYITQTGELLAGKMLMLDTQTMQSRVIKIGAATKTNITQLAQTSVAETISATALKALLPAGTIELIDIRGNEEHEDFNIGGRHIPAYKLERSLDSFDDTKTIVLYCTIGKRSADAVKRLRELKPGLNVVSLEGGVKAWVELDN
ncbi:ThiF family adenylyltransferase [Mucilaginibacter mali]|uniref:Molybdopterin-synthase adenylyltransferase n=1 Tax=Mucilaginibacter mali TaxID=2740462 RepID=A0A7D4UED1_9SPHI|nr:HesA/MoeB/ThiF family protein [Mucilaginibacter mali]QKJ31539.1 ThiF family adenylyltransferase [Mucilaginibacter mali]